MYAFSEIFYSRVSNAVFKKNSNKSRLSNEKYIMSVRFTKNTDKILIVYDRNTHSRRDFLNFVFKQRCDWQPLHMKFHIPKANDIQLCFQYDFHSTRIEREWKRWKPILI